MRRHVTRWPAETANGSAAGGEELVARLRAGSADAYREAVVRYSPRMLARARAIVGSESAEDVVQEAWIAVLRNIHGFEERAALSSWLMRIVSNRAISHLRSRAKEREPATDVGLAAESDPFDGRGRWAAPPTAWHPGSPDEVLNAEALEDCLDKHIRLLPEQQRCVLIMHDMDQQSYEVICNELHLSASNVRVLLHRARTKLMKMIDGFQETGKC